MEKYTKVMPASGLALTCTLCNIQRCIANDADEIVFDCKYENGDHAHIVTDNNGISITYYTGSGYVLDYTTNKNDEGIKSYYRKNRSEVSWGSQFMLKGKLEQLDSF